MKLTLEIPTEHTATILAMLATLMKPSTVEAQPDPAEGHPELPLDDESEEIAETRWAVPGIDAADPLKVEMEWGEDKRPRLIPVPGKVYWTRHGVVIHAERITFDGDIECKCDAGPFYYQADGTPRAAAACSPEWDLVEECPF